MKKNAEDFDIFEREQAIYDAVTQHVLEIKAGAPVNPEIFEMLTKEYGRILKQHRRINKMSDRATDNLNTSKLALEDQVYIDALTNVYNRRYLDETLAQTLTTLENRNGNLSVMMLDIDFFKRYNDTYGHVEGDDCLKNVAQTISESLKREGEFVARYGGEEFLAVLPNTDESGARILASHILENIRKLRIPHEKNEVIGIVTLSIGVTSARVHRSHSSSDYLKCVDVALYEAKQHGRNGYIYIDFEEGIKHEFQF